MLRDVSVREVMNADYVGVSESDGLVESSTLLLAEEADVGVVLRGEEAVGALTVANALATMIDVEERRDALVADAMTDDVPSIEPDRGLGAARDRMRTADTSWLVVTDGERPLGVVTERDVLMGSVVGTDPSATGDSDQDTPAMTQAPQVGTTATELASEDAFDDQGICEVCGALSADLVAVNGQLRCVDCRDV